MKIGDRVIIVGKEHPWKGHPGKIVDTFKRDLELDWKVEIDGGYYPGHTCAVGKHELVPDPHASLREY